MAVGRVRRATPVENHWLRVLFLHFLRHIFTKGVIDVFSNAYVIWYLFVIFSYAIKRKYKNAAST